MAAVLKISSGEKWHDIYPELGTEPIPIDPYVSHEYFEKERALIFRKVWLNLGRVEQIPKPGDYFVRDLAVCNTSILIVRGKDSTIRAFHNMCAHRVISSSRTPAGHVRGCSPANFMAGHMGLMDRCATSQTKRVSLISTNKRSA